MPTITFTLRTTRDIIDKIKYIADSNGRSTNKEIEQLLLEYINRYEQQYGKIVNP